MQHSNVLLGLLELAVPFYGLRLSRLFGTRQIGWALFMAFTALALLRLTGLEVGGLGGDLGLTWKLIYAIVPVLLLIGLAHVEAVSKERRRVEQSRALAKTVAIADERIAAVAGLDTMAQVAAAAAQHFNRHLGVINLYSKLLLQKSSDPDTSYHHKRIAEEATQAAELSRQLLAAGRTHPLRARLLNISRFLQQARSVLWRSLQPGMVLDIRTAEGLPLVKADPTHLGYILGQLVHNAVEACGPGATVLVEAESVWVNVFHARRHEVPAQGRFVRLTVSDSGSGMCPEVQAHLFEPFFTTKDLSSHSGLGLASANGLVKEHGGWIEVESQAGRGTTVQVYLPAIP